MPFSLRFISTYLGTLLTADGRTETRQCIQVVRYFAKADGRTEARQCI